MTSPRDYSKYKFNGETHGKGRLVLALVRRYVEDHPGTCFEALREAFPDALQAESPVQFSAMRVVVAKGNSISPNDKERFFFGEDERIELEDGPVVVSREWNLHNVQNILKRARKLGYEVEAVTSDGSPHEAA